MATPNQKDKQKARVATWLKKNQIVLSDCATFCFENLEAKEDEMSDFRIEGKLVLHDGNKKYCESIEIGWDIVGRPHLHPIVYHSPLGAPASFPKYILSDSLSQGVAKWIEDNIPMIRPISYYGPNEFSDRVISEEFYHQIERTIAVLRVLKVKA